MKVYSNTVNMYMTVTADHDEISDNGQAHSFVIEDAPWPDPTNLK